MKNEEFNLLDKVLDKELVIPDGGTWEFHNIYVLNRFLDKDPDFLSLKIDASICLNSTGSSSKDDNCDGYNYLKWDDAENLIYLLKRASGIFGGKSWAITNRKTNYLLFEYGFHILMMKLNEKNIIDLRKQIDDLHTQTQIQGGNLNIDINLDKIFFNYLRKENENGNGGRIWDEKIVLFLSRKQRDNIRDLKLLLGFDSIGVIGTICVLYSFRSIFGHCHSGNQNLISDFAFSDPDITKCDSEIISRERYFIQIVNKIDFLFDEYYESLNGYYNKLLYLSKLKLEKEKFKSEKQV